MLKDFKFKSVFSLDDSLHKSLYLANIDIPLSMDTTFLKQKYIDIKIYVIV